MILFLPSWPQMLAKTQSRFRYYGVLKAAQQARVLTQFVNFNWAG